MAYTAYNGDRCPAKLNNVQCALTNGHQNAHVTTDGRHFTVPDLLRKSILDEAFQRDLVTGERLHQVLKALHHRIDSIVSQAVNQHRDQLHKARVDDRLSVDELGDHKEWVKAEVGMLRQRMALLSAELVTTRSSRLSPLEDRVAKLELPYSQVSAVKDTHNSLVKRIERLEKDLRNTRELAERNRCCEHARDRAQTWDADSFEPLRDQTYVDEGGYRWKCFDYKGWKFATMTGSNWRTGMDNDRDGWTWTELVNGTAKDNDVDPQFPWKVWANG